MVTMKTIFRIGCLAVLMTGCAPPDAGNDEYRILLHTWNGPDHAKKAAAAKDAAERDGWTDLAMVGKQNATELYMGRYTSSETAEADLNRALTYTRRDAQIFPRARTILLPGKDIGPPEWNLLNVHPRYVYTVVIMSYHDDEKDNYFGRRQRAVDACRKLRNEGEQAYFHHGPKHSVVCVGLFKVNSVRVRRVDAPGPGGTRSGKVEQRIPTPEVRAVLERYPKIYDNDTHVKMEVATAAKPEGVDLRSAPRPGQGSSYGTMKTFYAQSYVISIPRRPSANDPFAGLGDS